MHSNIYSVSFAFSHLESSPGSLRTKRNRLLKLIEERLKGKAEFQINGHPEKS